MNEKDPSTSRPTLKAAGAFLWLRLMQTAWLLPLAALVLSPWIASLSGPGLALAAAYAAAGLIGGVRNAWGNKKVPAPGQEDPDDPAQVVGQFRLLGWRW
jgi:hypothetical protein